MKRRTQSAARLAAVGLFSLSYFASAAEKEKDITEYTTPFTHAYTPTDLVGPGSISIVTKGDIMMSFGGLIRIIPVYEDNWDFGINNDNNGLANRDFFAIHANEGGVVNKGYIRSEDRLYFNAMPKDASWSFYAALEFDSVLENSSVDARGGKNRSDSDFGLERLRGTLALGENHRLHAGWDIWHTDTITEGLALIYADDNPGVWLSGGTAPVTYSFGYWKLRENNFQTRPTLLSDGADNDRDLIAGYLDFKPNKDHKIRGIYTYDRIYENPVRTLTDLVVALGGTAPSPSSGFTGGTSDVNSHHAGAVYTGKFGTSTLQVEGVYQFGDADTHNAAQLARDNFDIRAFAFGADLTFDLSKQAGFGFKPHIGFIYTSGDDSPSDGKLEGYVANASTQRFVPNWGGEYSIPSDTHFLLGTNLYSFLPEAIGNGTPITTGGLENASTIGFGRGDNPGVRIASIGALITPKPFLVLRSNLLAFWWNEDFVATSLRSTAANRINTRVSSGYVGTEWDNSLVYAFNKNVFLKGEVSFFFPGDGVKDLTSAVTASRTGGVTTPGPSSDDLLTRVAMELLWTF